MRPRSGLLLAVLLGRGGAVIIPGADSAPFYKDKQIRLIISAGVAGGYMEYARALADFMPRHIRRQPQHPGAEHARRRRAQRHQFSLYQRAAGRHLYRHGAFDDSALAALGQPGRALRDDEVQLDRRLRPRARRLPDVGEGRRSRPGRTCWKRSRRSAVPARARRWMPIRRCSTNCSAPRSRWLPATRTAPRSICDGTRRGRWPLRRPDVQHQGDAARMADRAQDRRADRDLADNGIRISPTRRP